MRPRPENHLTLDALWHSAPGGAGAESPAKPVTLKIEPPAAGGDGILRVFEGQDFKETILLTPATYRLIAGGQNPASTNKDLSGRCILSAGGDGSDYVSVERAALASALRTIRPVEMTRAMRLVAAEPRTPLKSADAANRLIALFEQNWQLDITHTAVNEAVANIPSRRST